MDEIFIIIGLIILNGIFAMSEVALISARKSRLSTDAKKGNKAANIALKLANEPDRFLSTRANRYYFNWNSYRYLFGK